MNYRRHLEDVILKPWIEHAPDRAHGGFYGKLDHRWQPDPDAPKGLVQHSRFLWSFSAAYRRTHHPEYRRMADQARAFLMTHFHDRKHDGWFWSVEADGTPRDRRKHVYPHSFVIYAFAEYARAFDDSEARQTAIDTFQLLEQRARDPGHGGYRESFTENWAETGQHEDMGISGRRKSMNSHIHLLEAATTLLPAYPAARARLLELLELCINHIFNPSRASLDLFFEDDWTRLPSPTSYGHDIELSWLLDEAAQALGTPDAAVAVTKALATNTLKGLVTGQGLHYEGDATGRIVDRRRVWWVQAEALVGFLNAYQRTRDSAFLKAFEDIRHWICARQADLALGDWHEETSERGPATPGFKGHLWKEPYHQSRACLEAERRTGESHE